MSLIEVAVAVWPADKFLEDKVGGQLFQDTLQVLNATHLVAVLESRLQRGGLPIAIGRIEYFDDELQKWMDVVAEHDFAKFGQPVKLRVWSRRRRFNCKVHPLRGSATNYSPRTVSFFAYDLQEFETEMRARLPPSERDFKDILRCDTHMGWVLLESLGEIPVDAAYSDIKLVPKEHSVGVREVLMPPDHADLANLSETARLERVVAMEVSRREAAETEQARNREAEASRKIPAPSQSQEWMPSRISVSPLEHTKAEVSYLHNANFAAAAYSEQSAKPLPDVNREQCCYPGSGQVHSVDTGGHGELKRQVIAYVRALLQDFESPLVEYLPPRGLPTSDLVNVTALVAHHFMVRCGYRPDKPLTVDDKAHVHSIMAHVLMELPYNKERVRREKEVVEREAAPLEVEQKTVDLSVTAVPPQVVLMRPLMSSGTVVVYGSVTCSSPVECKWFLRTDTAPVDVEKIFERGFATTEPVSASSFTLKLLPGSLLKGVDYHLTLQATSDAPTRLSASSTQRFSLPR